MRRRLRGLIACALVALLASSVEPYLVVVRAAIGFDAFAESTIDTNTVFSWSHTISGSNRILFFGCFGDNSSELTLTGTYDSVATTEVTHVQVPSDRWIYLHYLVAPNTGAHNVVATFSGTTVARCASVSYTGAAQTGQPDSFNTATDSGSVDTLTATTTVVNTSWLVMFGKNVGDSPTAGTGTTKRSGASNSEAFFDSNGNVSAGSRSLQMNWTVLSTAAAIIASFKEPSAAAPCARTLLGVGCDDARYAFPAAR